MSASNLLSQLVASGRAFWTSRNVRERKMLSAAVVICIAGAIYALLIDPALSGRALLERELPRLRTQAAQMQALSQQASQLAAVPKPDSVPITRGVLENSLKQAGLNASDMSVSDRVVRVQFSAAQLNALLAWMEQMQAQQLFASDVDIGAASNTNSVKATISLVQRQGEP